MRVVLDEGVPEALAQYLPGHETSSVGELGWKGTKNGALLRLVESIAAEAFVTADKSLEKQQVLARRPFGILLLSTNNWQLIEQHIPAVVRGLDECKPGQVLAVECGRFIKKRFRRPGIV